MRPVTSGPQRRVSVLVGAALALILGCEGDHSKKVSPLPVTPPDLSGAWDTRVSVNLSSCGDLDVETIAGHILTLRQADRSLLPQSNAGGPYWSGPVLSCGAGGFGDDIVTLSLSGSVVIDPACTLGFTEQIAAHVLYPVEWDPAVPASAGLDPLLRIDGSVTLSVSPAGTCPVTTACSIFGEFTAAPRQGCPILLDSNAPNGCDPVWECVIPL